MPWVVWFTGLPGCGKTTIAEMTRDLLIAKGLHIRILQLDEIRRMITPKPTYSSEERDIVYASLAYMAKLLYEEDVNVFVDATANKRRYRDQARSLIPNFLEVYVKAPLEVCIERERTRKARFSPKGIYEKSKNGEAVPGVNVPYEEPNGAEILVDTTTLNPEASSKMIAEKIIETFKEPTPT